MLKYLLSFSTNLKVKYHPNVTMAIIHIKNNNNVIVLIICFNVQSNFNILFEFPLLKRTHVNIALVNYKVVMFLTKNIFVIGLTN